MLDGIPIRDFTPEFLLGLCVLMIMLGWLVPKRGLTNANQEAERWRKAYEQEREARVTADNQTGELLELARTTHMFLQGVFSNSERIRQSGEPDEILPPP